MPIIFKDLNSVPKHIEEDIINIASINESIKNILTTMRGTISGFPEFACTNALLFSPRDSISIDTYTTEVKSLLARFENRIEVLQFQVTPDRVNPNLVNVTLRYRIKATGETGTYTINNSNR